MELTTSNFSQFYIEAKLNGVTDKEFCVKFGLKLHDLGSIKKFLALPPLKCRNNEQGLSERELQIAVKNGITRRLALRRKRELGWSNYDCITRPKQQGKKLREI